MPRQDLIQVRRGTAAEWTAADPTLESGEIGFETDTEKFKIGPGAWSTLTFLPLAMGLYAAILPIKKMERWT